MNHRNASRNLFICTNIKNQEFYGLEILKYPKYQDTIFKSKFFGKIPKSTRDKINSAQSIFWKTHIFILAEANWELVENVPATSTAINYDPLVIGSDGLNLWLIDAFDITPVEQAMLDLSKINL